MPSNYTRVVSLLDKWVSLRQVFNSCCHRWTLYNVQWTRSISWKGLWKETASDKKWEGRSLEKMQNSVWIFDGKKALEDHIHHWHECLFNISLPFTYKETPCNESNKLCMASSSEFSSFWLATWVYNDIHNWQRVCMCCSFSFSCK